MNIKDPFDENKDNVRRERVESDEVETHVEG